MGGSEQEEPTALDRLDIGESNPPRIVVVVYHNGIYIYIQYSYYIPIFSLLCISIIHKKKLNKNVYMCVMGTSSQDTT